MGEDQLCVPWSSPLSASLSIRQDSCRFGIDHESSKSSRIVDAKGRSTVNAKGGIT